MKIIVFILNFYLLLLAAVPCADGTECNEPVDSKTALVLTHKAHDHDAEQCPPLCHCACCSTAAYKQPDVFFSFIRHDVVQQHAGVYVSYQPVVFLPAIWQPPHFIG
ncbi:DUF6660 family protein [Haoranjiania flava]|uniref:Secreted protein n=1 Tax=Haoranjiania flava TaxID=1856322 RepID=A0AAE3IM80_9BACT|nr:DUF6660 family protein [Haoranjiania flava]MCU7694642.1 hypothetical protein [Haoranjiania flava]